MRATELTLKQELAPILAERLGATFVTETSNRAGRRGGQLDAFLRFPACRIGVELEVGGLSQLLGGLVQADGYVREVSADVRAVFAPVGAPWSRPGNHAVDGLARSRTRLRPRRPLQRPRR